VKTSTIKWGAILFALFIILIIVMADMDGLRFLRLINRIPYGDKIGHFILYGILTLLVDLALFRSLPDLRPNLITLRVASILALLIGLEEFSQQYFPNRSSDLVDLASSYLGVIFFSWLALKIKVGAG
jgi:polysaccharide biosynthesis protein VpsQ